MRAAEARALFDANAETYDWVNRIISAGMDRGWRGWVAERAVTHEGAIVLEAMAGTGEISVMAACRGARVVAADASAAMLARARRKAAAAGVHIETVVTDLTGHPEVPGSFDAVVVSFGLRYVDDRHEFLRSMLCRLKEDGRLVLLEFCVPDPGILSTPASVYFFHVLPRIGSFLVPGSELYHVLPTTVRDIGPARDLERTVRDAGFVIEESRRFGFGIVAGIVARPQQL